MDRNRVSDNEVSYEVSAEDLPEAVRKRLPQQPKKGERYAVAVKRVDEDYDAWFRRKVGASIRKADAGGPFVAHEDVARWLRSWGTDRELPPPKATVWRPSRRRKK